LEKLASLHMRKSRKQKHQEETCMASISVLTLNKVQSKNFNVPNCPTNLIEKDHESLEDVQKKKFVIDVNEGLKEGIITSSHVESL